MNGEEAVPPFLPYGRQKLDDDDIAAVVEVLRGDWLTTGPAVGRFEQAWAERVGASHALACNSGTAGLHLAVLALGLGPGDRAVVPSITFLATANAVRLAGAEVVFADVDPDSGLMTPATLQAALARADGPVKAVLPVHLRGASVDMAALAAAALGLPIIEDAAHALGTTWQDGNVRHQVGDGAYSRMTVFSTHPVKTITTGEGGVVTTNDPALLDRLRRFRSHGMDHDSTHWTDRSLGFEAGEVAPWAYQMAELGLNYRLPDFACALGFSQLSKLDSFLTRRREIVARYDGLFAPLAPLLQIPRCPEGNEPGWHLYSPLIDFEQLGKSRSRVMRELRHAGVGSQVHYIPVHRQPYYQARYGGLDLPGADTYYRRTLSLPLFPAMTDSDVERVAAAVTAVLESARS
jgi:UDP-4-amino-4,6-dideoxy-N-acetyl-beta-L-altrosamine transaminase